MDSDFVEIVKPNKTHEEYDEIQEELFTELNKLRKNPKSYIPLVESQMDSLLNNNILLKKGSHLKLQTIEGRKAYEEAIIFLEEQEPVAPLKRDHRLTNAALDLINDIGPRGVVSHQDINGQYVSDRIEKFCEWDFCANECIETSSANAQDILISLLVDDGMPERLDRRSLFQHIYNYVGIGCGYHKEYESITVFVFAGSIRPKGSLFYQFDSKFDEVSGKESYRNSVNDYQIDDPDAPDNTIGMRLVKTHKNLNNKIILVTKKFYLLDDGTEHVVELEEY